MEARARVASRRHRSSRRAFDPFDTLSICRFENLRVPGGPPGLNSIVMIQDLEIISGPRPLVGSPIYFWMAGEQPVPEHEAAHLDRNFHLYVLGEVKKHHETFHAARVSLLALRLLCQRGRATPPPGLLTRLFSSNCFAEEPPPGIVKARKGVLLPDCVFMMILEYWIQPDPPLIF